MYAAAIPLIRNCLHHKRSCISESTYSVVILYTLYVFLNEYWNISTRNVGDEQCWIADVVSNFLYKEPSNACLHVDISVGQWNQFVLHEHMWYM